MEKDEKKVNIAKIKKINNLKIIYYNIYYNKR